MRKKMQENYYENHPQNFMHMYARAVCWAVITEMREGWPPTVRIRKHSVGGCFDIVGDTMAELATPLKCRGGPGGPKRAALESLFFSANQWPVLKRFASSGTQQSSLHIQQRTQQRICMARGWDYRPHILFSSGESKIRSFAIAFLVSILTILTHSYHVRCSRNAVLMMIWWWWWLTMTGYTDHSNATLRWNWPRLLLTVTRFVASGMSSWHRE